MPQPELNKPEESAVAQLYTALIDSGIVLGIRNAEPRPHPQIKLDISDSFNFSTRKLLHRFFYDHQSELTRERLTALYGKLVTDHTAPPIRHIFAQIILLWKDMLVVQEWEEKAKLKKEKQPSSKKKWARRALATTVLVSVFGAGVQKFIDADVEPWEVFQRSRAALSQPFEETPTQFSAAASATATQTPEATASPTATLTATPVDTLTATPTQTEEHTSTPSTTPVPSHTPTQEATATELPSEDPVKVAAAPENTDMMIAAEIPPGDVEVSASIDGNGSLIFTGEDGELLNAEWQNFEVYEEPSPQIMEGFATRYGPSSMSIGSITLTAKEINRKVASGQLKEEDLTVGDKRIQAIYQQYLIALEEGNLNSYSGKEFDQKFVELVLHPLGYDGMGATKSSADSGRVYEVRLYDYVTEEWTEPYRMLVIDVSQEGSFYRPDGSGLRDQRLTFFDGTPRRWVLDVPNEFLSLSNLDHTTGPSFVRMEEEGFSRTVTFTESDGSPDIRLNAAYQDMITKAYELLKSASPEDLAEIVANAQAYVNFNFEANGYSHERDLDRDTFFAYLLYQLSQKNGDGTALEINMYSKSLEDEMTIPEPHFGVGLSLGFHHVYEFFSIAAKSGSVDRQVVHFDRPLGDQVPSNSVFFVEQVGEILEEPKPIQGGFLIVEPDGISAVFYDEKGIFHTIPLTQLESYLMQTYNSRSRVVSFSIN
jgi:hypothetical protein